MNNNDFRIIQMLIGLTDQRNENYFYELKPHTSEETGGKSH